MALGILIIGTPALAQPAQEAARARLFDVYGYAIQGRNLLKGEDFTHAVSPFVGRNRTAVDIERARSALQQTYHDLGHCSVTVGLARREPQDGVVTFVLTETPGGAGRECLPMVALHGAPRPAPVETRTPVPDAEAKISDVAPGIAVTPYIEGAGKRGLILASDSAPGNTAPVSGARWSEQPAKAQMPEASGRVASAAPVSVSVSVPEATPAPAPAPTAVAAAGPLPGATQIPLRLAQAGAQPPVSPAEAPAPQALKFNIERFDVEGNTLLDQKRVEGTLAPFTGTGKDFGDVQRALEALQLVYQREGYGGVEIRLPEQELDRGVVKFRVVESRIGRITVEGNEHFSTANIRRSVPGLREGETPNSREIAKGIRLANENSAKQSTVVLRASEREDQLDAVIRVTDVDPKRFSVSLDNTATKATHRYRLGFAFQHGNVFDRDHVFTGQFITSPANYHDVYIYGAGYRIPFYSLGDSVDIIAGYSNVDSGNVGDLFVVSGKGAVYALRYNHGLRKWGEIEHKISFGLDYRAYQNQVTTVGGVENLVPDITVHPLSLTYSANTRLAQRDLSFYAVVAQNIPGGSDGQDEDFKQPGARFQVGTAGYRLFRMGGSYSGELAAGWQFRIRLDGQYTDDALVAGEQFGIGGADSVRGFSERYTANDKGYRSNWEIYTPDLAKGLGLENSHLRFLAFYDSGRVRRNQPLASEASGASLDSAGLGLRFNYKTNLTLRLDFAQVLHDGTQQLEPNGRRNSKKGHFSVAWTW